MIVFFSMYSGPQNIYAKYSHSFPKVCGHLVLESVEIRVFGDFFFYFSSFAPVLFNIWTWVQPAKLSVRHPCSEAYIFPPPQYSIGASYDLDQDL